MPINPAPTVGRIVLVALPDREPFISRRCVGEIRPAIVVRVWNPPGSPHADMVNLQVFTDGANDTGRDGAAGATEWLTSASQHQPAPDSTEKQRPGTWSWMPYQLGQAARAEAAEAKAANPS